jgi:hypothetical protein
LDAIKLENATAASVDSEKCGTVARIETVISLGKLLIVAGGLLIVFGAIALVAGRMNIPIGQLPGDINYRAKNTTFFFPITTCILLSIVLSFIMWLVNRFLR